MKILIRSILVFLCFCLFIPVISVAQNNIKTLILTGQNNHNWEVSHVAIKQILENSGLFQVDLAISPKTGDDMSQFIVDFNKYQLVILDYNGDKWPDKTNNNFLEYLKKGGGLVVYHAANNAFTEWKEFNETIALGGWNGRTEKDGSMYHWKNGKLFEDKTPGPGGSHGHQHEFVLNCRKKNHPVTKGLPTQWKHTQDELYDKMRGPGNIKDLLYTAYSDPSTNGSGNEEPLIFTVDYGKSRIFHTMLGHAGASLTENTAMQCTGFQVTLLRGAEWAATGKVTQKVPTDFPTSTKISLRPDYK